jgi:transcriptional regulator with XRE-family HTH domain
MKIIKNPNSPGKLIFVDERNRPIDFAVAIGKLRNAYGADYLADRCGVSRRTVDGWLIGRMPSTAALKHLAALAGKKK